MDALSRIPLLKWHDKGMHATGGDECAGDVQMGRESEDRRMLRALVGQQMGHDATQREDEQFGACDAVGQSDGGFDGLVLVGLERGIAGEAPGRVFVFNAAYDGVEHLDALLRVASDARFSTEHDAVHLLDDRVEDIGHFGARRHGVFDHAFEHLRGHDDFASVVGAAFDDLALDDWQVFDGALAAEVAARDHDAAAGFHESVDVGDGLLVFDFGDDACLAAFLFEQELQVLEVPRLACEAQREVVHAQLDAEIEIGVVFLRQGWQAHRHAGEIDVSAGLHLSFDQNGADDALGGDSGDLDLDQAAIDHDDVAHFEVAAELGVVDGHGVARGGWSIRFAEQFDHIADLELPGLLHIARADAGACEIHEHCDLTPCGRGGGPHTAMHGAHPFMGSVTHVQANDVCTFGNEGGDDFLTFRCWAEGAEDFGFAHENGREVP